MNVVNEDMNTYILIYKCAYTQVYTHTDTLIRYIYIHTYVRVVKICKISAVTLSSQLTFYHTNKSSKLSEEITTVIKKQLNFRSESNFPYLF